MICIRVYKGRLVSSRSRRVRELFVTHFDGVDRVHNGVFLQVQLAPTPPSPHSFEVNQQLCLQKRRLSYSAAARSLVVEIHSWGSHRVSIIVCHMRLS